MKLTQARIDAIANRYHPEGWRVFESKTRKREGKAHYPSRTILVPLIHDVCTLHNFLHECAHALLHHWGDGASTLHREEYEAERWAIEIARQNGIAVPRSIIIQAKVYVRSCIARDRKKKIAIEPHVEKWAKG